MLIDQRQFTRFDSAFIDIKVACIAFVTTIRNVEIIGRPPSEEIHDLWFIGECFKRCTIRTCEIELCTFVAADIACDEQVA